MLQQQKGNFLLLSDAYSLRSYLYRKEVNGLMLTTNFVIWLAFGKGVWGTSPTSSVRKTRMSAASEWLANTTLAKPKWSIYAEKTF